MTEQWQHAIDAELSSPADVSNLNSEYDKQSNNIMLDLNLLPAGFLIFF